MPSLPSRLTHSHKGAHPLTPYVVFLACTSHSLTHTHSCLHSRIHSLTHSLTPFLAHSLAYLTYALAHLHSYSRTHQLPHSFSRFTYSRTHIHTLKRPHTHSLFTLIPSPRTLCYAHAIFFVSNLVCFLFLSVVLLIRPSVCACLCPSVCYSFSVFHLLLTVSPLPVSSDHLSCSLPRCSSLYFCPLPVCSYISLSFSLSLT